MVDAANREERRAVRVVVPRHPPHRAARRRRRPRHDRPHHRHRPRRHPARTEVFTLGVASGDPAPDGVVLWTRLARDPRATRGGMTEAAVDVDWQVADDERFTRVRASGRTRTGPEDGYAVHVEVGGLPAGGTFHYRFAALGHLSPTGTTRTAPRRAR